MLSIHILCVGKLKEKFFAAACGEYAKRLGSYCHLTVTELNEQRLPDQPSPAQIAYALEKEGRALLSRLPKGGRVYALCVEGSPISSEGLAERLND